MPDDPSFAPPLPKRSLKPCGSATQCHPTSYNPSRPDLVRLRYEGRKRVNHADDVMARITADRLVRHLTVSGFVLMKRPPATAPTTGGMPPGRGSDAG